VESINIQSIATRVGDIAKWGTSVNEIDREGSAVLKVSKSSYPHGAITSVRQQCIYDWLCSFGSTHQNDDRSLLMIVDFCLAITTKESLSRVIEILEDCGIPKNITRKKQKVEFAMLKLHEKVLMHSEQHYISQQYAHAVFEACKAYHKYIETKTGYTDSSSRSLVQYSWTFKQPRLRATSGSKDSDEKYHDGLKLLSEGIFAGIRNVQAHEPILDWPLSKEDCIDLLRLISFLFRQVDKSTWLG
jgi:uncharacterized protein (TIGR02391 family)